MWCKDYTYVKVRISLIKLSKQSKHLSAIVKDKLDPTYKCIQAVVAKAMVLKNIILLLSSKLRFWASIRRSFKVSDYSVFSSIKPYKAHIDKKDGYPAGDKLIIVYRKGRLSAHAKDMKYWTFPIRKVTKGGVGGGRVGWWWWGECLWGGCIFTHKI